MKIDNENPSVKTTIAILAVLLLCGIYLRFYNLGELSFWVDEMNHVYAGMSLAKGEAPEFPSGVDNERALLYSRTVAWSFGLFGVSEFSARFSSAVFGLLSILLIFWVGKELFNRRVGLIAAFFLTFAHPAVGWSRTSRMYTLFQLLFLLGVYFYYKGFEAKTRSPRAVAEDGNLLIRLRASLYNQGIRWPWLIGCGIVLLVSMQVHQLTGLVAVTLFVFWVFAFAGAVLRDGLKPALDSKYFLALSVSVVAASLGFVLFDLTSFVQYALSFHPTWAQYAKAEDPFYYYWTLTASDQFPLAALFLIGALQAWVRLHKTAIFCFLVFMVPLAMQSFVFSYKIENYIFNIYPFFLLVIAFGVNNLLTIEMPKLESVRKKMGWIGEKLTSNILRRGVIAVFIFAICSTVWFRVAVGIPRIEGAGSNGAVIHYNWRTATEFVAQNGSEEDVVISTLPLTVLYYLGRIDYNLNQAHLDESLRWETESTNGRHHEFYTGVPSIESVDDLKRVIADNSNGWLIVDRYRMEREQYVSKDLAEYIRNDLEKKWSDKRNIVQVYHWTTSKGDT